MSEIIPLPQLLSCAVFELPREGEHGFHTQPANEFFLSTQGGGVHQTAQGEFQFDVGDVYFFPRGLLHQHEKRGDVCEALSFRIRDEAFENGDETDRIAFNVLEQLKREALLGHHRIPNEDAYAVSKSIHALWAVYCTPSPYRSCRLKAGTLELLSTIGEQLPERDFNRVDPIFHVIHAIEKSPAAPHTVDDLASLAGLSRSHLQALFKQTTQSTISRYISRLRIGMAVIQLTNTDKPIANIALDCGFPTLSHFYNAFKRERGHSPGQARQLNMKNMR